MLGKLQTNKVKFAVGFFDLDDNSKISLQLLYGEKRLDKKNKKTVVLQDIAKMLTIVKGETKKSSK